MASQPAAADTYRNPSPVNLADLRGMRRPNCIDLAVGEVLPDGHKVRYRIHHDTSYARQSYAVAEIWHPGDLRWNEIATCLPSVWAGGSIFEESERAAAIAAQATEGDTTAGAATALAVLQARTRAILKGAK